ncbi:DEAD/DEAH box helicase family protein [Shewanella sp. ALD9]|uniref:DEAD/DEAH box helicase family protein n=1 Tax=Shewanella sp. ALD9 TaxID=2058330 RepID=UPI000C34EE8D|nr:DEAD/DEAH box helicase family protein [Shewanella sp. ALD9]PKH32651.1 restriction endonuclease subunit R [Shewanella sp. ALD9]
MNFSALNLKTKYDSDEDDILNSFHVPLFACAKQYDRAVGYFSSEVLVSAVEGLSKFVQSNGKMRLIIGDPLSDSEYEAVMEGRLNLSSTRSEAFVQLLSETENKKLKLLTYLVANEKLDIKFAFTHKGMFHKKVGIFYQDDETVVFSGSANETVAALTDYNSEEISVFFSWGVGFAEYGKIEIDNFNLLWANKKNRVKVVSLDSDAYKKIKSSVDIEQLYSELFSSESSVKTSKSEKPFFSYSFPKSRQELIRVDAEAKLPVKPLMVKGRPFELFDHQKEAIKSWVKSGYCGLFKLATGSGKTFTSISALVELYETRHKQGEPTFVIISVPYIELANQWVSELQLFNIIPVKCYESSDNWVRILDKKILLFRSASLSFVCIVVVNKTLSSDVFQSKICKVMPEKILLIGDECHHLGSQGLFESLPPCKFRIGLSATPFRNEDDEVEGSPFPDTAKQNLVTYFKGIISEYSLSDAIRDGILSPYRYDIVTVYLDDAEQEQYEEYSLKIQKMILKARNNSLLSEERVMLTSLCGARSRLLATCSGKLPALINYLMSKNMSMEHSLIYVGEGKSEGDEASYITRVTNRLHEYGLKVAKFTSQESSVERNRIMTNFKLQIVDSLVAMKVLDEGIDVPVCKSAFILASTRNPRQYVQRRGRVLRKSKDKNEALIVDFVVLPPLGSRSKISQNLVNAELERINDFKLTAINSQEIDLKLIELGIE